MKNYLIMIMYFKPYPLERKYTIQASSFPVAIKRACDLFRAEMKGVFIKKLVVKMAYLSPKGEVVEKKEAPSTNLKKVGIPIDLKKYK